MSGRKSTEVNGLLARGRNARESGIENFIGKFNNSKKQIRDNQNKINSISDRIDKQQIEIRPECRLEFPTESDEIQRKYDAIKKANVKVDYEKDIEAAEKERQSLDTELSNADKEEERISSRIKTKSWYCDEEYKDAGKLVSIYEKINQKKNALISKLKGMVQRSDKKLVEYQNMEKQMSQVVAAEQQLNEKTVRIVELREKATDSKNYIKDMINKINPDLAIKFCQQEYSDLKSEIQHFCEMSDDEVLKDVAKVSEKISVFSYKVDTLYSEFLERYEKIETGIKSCENLLKTNANFYYDPVEYFKKKDEAEKIAVLDYLTEYSDKIELVDSIKNGIKQAKQLLEEEKFDEAEKKIEALNSNIDQANEYAALLQEHMIENFYVAKDMTNVMKKMGFSTGAYKIDGHIKNGWRISASNPNGETIDFSRVFVDNEGKVNIDIDHKTTGDCPSKWSDITAELEAKGIYIEKITMENGTEVINKRKNKMSISSETDATDEGTRAQI